MIAAGSLTRMLVLSGCLVVSALWLERATKSEATPLRAPLADFPMNLTGWKGQSAGDLEPKILAVLGASEYLNRVYTAGAGAPDVGLYVGYYKSQRQGESMHSPMNCLPGSGWQPVASGRATIAIPPDSAVTAGLGSVASSIEVNRYVVQKGLDKLLVLYWYQSHGRVVASEYWGRIYMVADAVRLNRTDGALIRVVVPIADSVPSGEERAERTGLDFVRAMFPLLGRHLPV